MGYKLENGQEQAITNTDNMRNSSKAKVAIK